MAALFAICPDALAAGKRTIVGTIRDYECGDLCHLFVVDARGKQQHALCGAPLCGKIEKTPKRFAGRKIRATVTGEWLEYDCHDQFDVDTMSTAATSSTATPARASFEAPRLAVCQRPHTALAQVQEPGAPGGEARGGEGLGEAEVKKAEVEMTNEKPWRIAARSTEVPAATHIGAAAGPYHWPGQQNKVD